MDIEDRKDSALGSQETAWKYKHKDKEAGKMNDGKIYKTVDLYLGAFLKARGIELLDVDRADRRVTFLFKDGAEVQKLVTGFYNDAEVGVSAYKNALRDLKSLIYKST